MERLLFVLTVAIAKVAGNIQNCGGNSGFHAVKDSGYQRAGGKGGSKQGDH